MKSFEQIWERASKRKGGDAALEELVAVSLKSPDELRCLGDDRYLSLMTSAIFKAGFTWKVVDKKWPGFEEAFWQFNVKRCAYMSPDDVDALTKDVRIVRNATKINTVLGNAQMILDISVDHGSFGAFIANWPAEDYSGLLAKLNRQGERLGAMTCQYFLRSVGRDGYILGRDGVAALIDAGVIEKNPSSKKAMAQVQAAYSQWAKETGRSFSVISRILALSMDV